MKCLQNTPVKNNKMRNVLHESKRKDEWPLQFTYWFVFQDSLSVCGDAHGGHKRALDS